MFEYPLEIVLAAIIAASIAGLALTATIFVYLRTRETRYDQELKRIQLEAMRMAIERRIYELNDDLLASDDRWRDVNHILLSSQEHSSRSRTRRGVALTSFLESYGLNQQELKVSPRLVFVLTPFHESFQPVFDAIASTCRRLGLEAYRGDEEFIEGDVLGHVLRMIVKARLVIAVVDGRNPNVFYELGVAHGLDKQTILVARAAGSLPFDLRTKKIVMYSTTDDLREQLSDELARSLVEARI